MGQSRWRVLLVGGDEAHLARIGNLLARPGGDLDRAETRAAALAALDADGYDACLVADRPGPCGGLDVIQTARARGCRIPLILLADAADPDRDRAALDAGASAYLVAGETDAPLLDRTLRYAAAQRRTEAALRAAVRELEQRAFHNTVLAEMANLL
jgi:DNA-binding response OmpR family regulator